MAGTIDFGLLKPELAGSFAAGYAGAEKNRLQNEATKLETETGRYKLEELKRDRETMLQLQNQLKSMGKDPDLDKVFDALIATGNPQYVTQGLEGKKRLQAQREFAKAQGLEMPGMAPDTAAAVPTGAPSMAPFAPTTAPPVAPASQNELGSGMFGMPAAGAAPTNALAPTVGAAPTAPVAPVPRNALAPTAPVAPANALAAGPDQARIGQMRTRIDNLLAFAAKYAGTAEGTQALQQAKVYQDQLEADMRQKAPATPAGVQEFEMYMKMTPEQRAVFREFKKAGTASTNVNIPGQKYEGSYETAAGTKTFEEDQARVKTAQAIPNAIAKVDETLNILRNEDVNTGLGADVFNVIDKAKAQFAADKKAGKRVTSTEYLDSLLGSDVFPQISALGIGARGLDTPAEREFLRKVITGSIALNKDTLIRMTELRRRGLESAATAYNKSVDSGELKRYFDTTGRKPYRVELGPAGRTVVRRGTYGGRKVVEYSDGSIEYGD